MRHGDPVRPVGPVLPVGQIARGGPQYRAVDPGQQPPVGAVRMPQVGEEQQAGPGGGDGRGGEPVEVRSGRQRGRGAVPGEQVPVGPAGRAGGQAEPGRHGGGEQQAQGVGVAGREGGAERRPHGGGEAAAVAEGEGGAGLVRVEVDQGGPGVGAQGEQCGQGPRVVAGAWREQARERREVGRADGEHVPDDGDEPGPGPCGGPGGESVGPDPGQGGRDRTVQGEGGTAGGGEVGRHPDGGGDGAGAFASDRDHRAAGQGVGVRPAVGGSSGGSGPRAELVQDGGCPGSGERADAGQLVPGRGSVGDEDKPAGLEPGDPRAQFVPGVLAVADGEGEVCGTGLDPPVNRAVRRMGASSRSGSEAQRVPPVAPGA